MPSAGGSTGHDASGSRHDGGLVDTSSSHAFSAPGEKSGHGPYRFAVRRRARGCSSLAAAERSAGSSE